jgi:predicted dehydrogenase
MSNGTGTFRLGIVGCGSIAEHGHLPAAFESRGVEVTALVDTSAARLRTLQGQFALDARLLNDPRGLVNLVDGVILAVPNSLHAEIGSYLLSGGIHVLCEKPLAMTVAECAQMNDAARAGRATLAAGFVTRFFPSVDLLKQLLVERVAGRLARFDYEFGTAGGWDAVSAYNLTKEASGGGVLVVSGIHFLDRMLYLFGDVEVVSHRTDSRGGVEGNSVLEVLATVDDVRVPGRIVLSKTHALKNRLLITGTNGTLELGERQSLSVTYRPKPGLRHHEIHADIRDDRKPNFFRDQIEDFVDAVRSKRPPRVTGTQGTRSVALIQAAYGAMTRLDEPWCDSTLDRLRQAFQTTKAVA